MSEQAAMDEHDEADLFCQIHDELKRERRTYNCSTGETRRELYCYTCENTALWCLARSVGK